MRHIDFFSGAISGFSFAASHVWPDCEHVAFCEIDPWRRKQLARLWPGVPIIEDINDEKQIAAYASSFGLGTRRSKSVGQRGESRTPECGGKLSEQPWDMHWLQAIRDLCAVVDERKPDNSRDTIEAERAKWIAALGDSVVVPLVIEIMEAIKAAGLK
jgi:hypothetical protein